MHIKKLNEEIQKLLNEEVMYEMATVTYGNKQYISVNPDSSRGWYNEEYFKVYNSENYRAATGIARIKFRDASYTTHSNSDGKENWKLNSKDKKQLIKLLQSPSKKVKGITNWQYAILQFNLEAYADANWDECLLLTIEEQSGINNKNPKKYWLPIDLPMPNYMEL